MSKSLPLYCTKKKGPVWLIKVAQPATWWALSKWVWLETHPDEIADYDPERDRFVHIDGDYNNNAPDNIVKITKSQFMAMTRGGPLSKDPDINRARLAAATLKLAIMDQADKLGQVYTAPNGVREHKATLEKARRAYMERLQADPERLAEYRERTRATSQRARDKRTPEQKEAAKERQREYNKRYYAELQEDPERLEKKRASAREWVRRMSPEQKERRREYVRRYRAKQKAKKNIDKK